MSNRKRLFLPGTSLSAPLRGLPPAGRPSCVGQASGRGPPGGTAGSLPRTGCFPTPGKCGERKWARVSTPAGQPAWRGPRWVSQGGVSSSESTCSHCTRTPGPPLVLCPKGGEHRHGGPGSLRAMRKSPRNQVPGGFFSLLRSRDPQTGFKVTQGGLYFTLNRTQPGPGLGLPQPSSVSFRNSSWRSGPCGGPASGTGSVSPSVSKWYEYGVHRAPRAGGRSGLFGQPLVGRVGSFRKSDSGGPSDPGTSSQCPGPRVLEEAAWRWPVPWLGGVAGLGDGPGCPLFLCFSVALCPLCLGAIQPTAAVRPPHGAWVGMGWGQDRLVSTQGPLPRSCPPTPSTAGVSSPPPR